MKKTLIILALTAPIAAHADDWTGRDKALHLAGGAAISAAVMTSTKSEAVAFAAGCGVGALKEIADTQRPNHTASAKDLAVTCAGAYVGIKATGIVLTARGVTYNRSF